MAGSSSVRMQTNELSTQKEQRRGISVAMSGLLSTEIGAERLAERMAEAWNAGDRRPAEEWIFDVTDPDTAVRVIYEEICLREEAGEIITKAEYAGRFPEYEDRIADLLACHDLVEPNTPPPMPETGDEWQAFRLVNELGRGAVGRVFLAEDTTLGDRQVVIKFTPCRGNEYLSLARLQHSHIAPLYSVLDDEPQNLRAHVMPYLGGETLGDLLSRMTTRSGQALLEQLDRPRDIARPIAFPQESSARRFLAQANWTQVVCWIGACLADAVGYLHERGLVHCDIKPSNILIAADGQPMLLDFNLAVPPTRAGSPPLAWFGGTYDYMSPEQETVMTALNKGESFPKDIDGRTDLYSLGLVLYEALAGKLPEDIVQPPRLNRIVRGVTPGLADIIQHCLEPELEDRYPDAAALAEDFRRHLTDRPLRGVPNRSLQERFSKLRRRQPWLLSGVMVLVALTVVSIAAAGLGGVYWRDHYRAAERNLDQARTQLAAGRVNAAAEHLTAVERFVNAFPLDGELENQLTELRQEFENRQLADQLQRLVGHLRAVAIAGNVSRASLERLHSQSLTFWERYQQRPTTGDESIDLQSQLLEFAWLWAELQKRVLSDSEASTNRVALFAEVQKRTGSQILDRPLTLAGERSQAELVAQGRILLQVQRIEAAELAFRQALERQPDCYAAAIGLAALYVQGNQPTRALDSLRICQALRPQDALLYEHRGRIREQLNQYSEALADYVQATTLDPELGSAFLARGLLEYRLNHYANAVEALTAARRLGASPVVVDDYLARLKPLTASPPDAD